MAAFTFINIRGLELTGWSLIFIRTGVMVPLLLFPVWGIVKGTGNPFTPILSEGKNVLTSLNLGLVIMMWMYSGWESTSTLAGEIENPQEVIPQALMIGTLLVIATQREARGRASRGVPKRLSRTGRVPEVSSRARWSPAHR